MPPLLHLSPPTKEGPAGPLWIPPWSERSSVRTSRKELDHPFGPRNRRAFAQSANSVGDVRTDEPLPNGGSNGGPVGPPWSFRKRGESRGEKNPLETVFLPSGVLLPSFPTREKKVGPQAETPAPVAPAGAKLCYQASKKTAHTRSRLYNFSLFEISFSIAITIMLIGTFNALLISLI